jgi:alpha-beta hydrolase superfamily lysophospholipase
VRQAADWIAARYGLDRRSVHLLIARFAAEVDRYINLSDCRVRARQAVTTQLLDYSPQVVIAHSLGSVVAYEALFEMTPHPIDLLITIGSPIGTFRFHSAAAYLGCSAMAGLLAAYLDPA